MSELLPIAVQVTVFLLMLIVGMDCTLRDPGRPLRGPALVSSITLAQFTLVPQLAVATGWLLGLEGTLAASLLLLCCCPAGTISNSYTFLSRGNSAQPVILGLFARWRWPAPVQRTLGLLRKLSFALVLARALALRSPVPGLASEA